ncbi:drug/metabolite transporter (DMT)-like permease [Plantactinospora soyae]|uniref:Drug/metabolite transporter (DMT)-like permease n=1 Tax=Plantactinospora soyae TaxID=1544732 RepID=A0A927M941_9ACTN|nr:drug/metabolite transporter (DMT)-like permease [Plantactinospora soyae]
MIALVLAIALSVASAAAYAAAAVLQERLAAQAGSTTTAGRGYLATVLGRAGWWGSVALNGTGAALHVAALAYGPLSVVQPLGVLTLVLALPIGAAAIGRRATGRQWLGAGATVAGLALLLALTLPGAGDHELATGHGWLLTGVATVLVAGLVLAGRTRRSALPRSLLTATAAGIAFAVASALTQLVSQLVGGAGPLWSTAGLMVALAGMATAGLLLSQVAYRGAGLGAPLATVTLANPVASAAIAMLLLGERTAGGGLGALAALAGAGLAAWGVLLLAAADRATPTGRRGRARRRAARAGARFRGAVRLPWTRNRSAPAIRSSVSPTRAGRIATAPPARRRRSRRRSPCPALPTPASKPPGSGSAPPGNRPG